MSKLDQEYVRRLLQAIANHLSQGVLPVHNGHLEDHSETNDVLHDLLALKEEGLISGDVVSRGAKGTPYRMTNIRLTYLGIRLLGS